jgi:hypothetical protein
MPANEVHLAFGCSQPPVRSPSARGQREFSLPERVNGAILSPRRTESGECRFNLGVLVTVVQKVTVAGP